MPPKRKRASPADEVGAVNNGAGKDEGAEQLPAAGAAVEPANKKARAEDVPPGPPQPSEQPEWASDEGAEWCPLDALAAVCEWVDSTADLVRLSCVSRTWRQLVAREGLWRRRFLAERGQAAHDALALALDLHGPAALSSFLAQARRPPALPADSAPTTIARMEHVDDDDDEGEIKNAASTCVVKETEEGGHGLGVWFEALVSTDKKMWWRRWLANLERLEPSQGMSWMARLVRAAKHRADLEQRVVEWLDADGKGRNQGADDDDDGKKSDSDHDSDDGDDDGSEAYDQDTGRLKAPQLKNELQKKQVRALLHMARIVDHLSSSCSDDYRGSDSQYSVETCKVFCVDASVAGDADPLHPSVHANVKNWAYAANTARDDNPDVRPRLLPEFFDRLRLDLLHSNQEKNEKEENLSLEQFLYFIGLALDLGDTDEYERGYTPLQALIAQGTVARGTQSSHDDDDEEL